MHVETSEFAMGRNDHFPRWFSGSGVSLAAGVQILHGPDLATATAAPQPASPVCRVRFAAPVLRHSRKCPRHPPRSPPRHRDHPCRPPLSHPHGRGRLSRDLHASALVLAAGRWLQRSQRNLRRRRHMPMALLPESLKKRLQIGSTDNGNDELPSSEQPLHAPATVGELASLRAEAR
jgi:hypothetical protein